MPVLKFTQADKLKSALCPDGWYSAEVIKVDGPKKSSSKKSNNMFFDIKITEGDYKDKEFTLTFNDAIDKPFGARMWPQEWMLQLIAAIQGVSFDEVIPDKVNTDDLLNMPFDMKVLKGIFDGVPENSITAFLPLGKGAEEGATAPF